jgi:hypothetical protein
MTVDTSACVRQKPAKINHGLYQSVKEILLAVPLYSHTHTSDTSKALTICLLLAKFERLK